MTPLQIGDHIPAFSLPDRNGESVQLSSLGMDHCLLYFYPKDDTPGCTIEAQGFNTLLSKFHEAGTEVLGVSGGDATSKQKFCDKYGLSIKLVSDPDFDFCKSCGLFGEKTFMGRTYMGVFRSSFLVNAAGQIIKIYENVDPQLHPAEALNDVRALRGLPPLPIEPAAAPSKPAPEKKSTKKAAPKKAAKPKKSGSKKAPKPAKAKAKVKVKVKAKAKKPASKAKAKPKAKSSLAKKKVSAKKTASAKRAKTSAKAKKKTRPKATKSKR